MTKKEYAQILHDFEPDKSISSWMKIPKDGLKYYYEEVYLPAVMKAMMEDAEEAERLNIN